MAGLLATIDFKDIVVGRIKNLADEKDLVGVQVPLADFVFCHRASGDVAAVELELGGQSILSHTLCFPDFSDILANLVLNYPVHNITILHLYWNNYS